MNRIVSFLLFALWCGQIPLIKSTGESTHVQNPIVNELLSSQTIAEFNNIISQDSHKFDVFIDQCVQYSLNFSDERLFPLFKKISESPNEFCELLDEKIKASGSCEVLFKLLSSESLISAKLFQIYYQFTQNLSYNRISPFNLSAPKEINFCHQIIRDYKQNNNDRYLYELSLTRSALFLIFFEYMIQQKEIFTDSYIINFFIDNSNRWSKQINYKQCFQSPKSTSFFYNLICKYLNGNIENQAIFRSCFFNHFSQQHPKLAYKIIQAHLEKFWYIMLQPLQYYTPIERWTRDNPKLFWSLKKEHTVCQEWFNNLKQQDKESIFYDWIKNPSQFYLIAEQYPECQEWFNNIEGRIKHNLLEQNPKLAKLIYSPTQTTRKTNKLEVRTHAGRSIWSKHNKKRLKPIYSQTNEYVQKKQS